MITLMKANGKKEFKPHIAVCHMSEMINGGSANGENTPLVLKAKEGGEKLNTILKALGEKGAILEKASFQNTRRQLEASLKAKMTEDNPTKEYVWVDVEDFDEDTVVFYFDGNTYSIGYTVTEAGMVELTGEVEVAISHRVYSNAEGTELVLKSATQEVSESEEATSEEETEEEGSTESESEEEALEDNKDNEEENEMSEVILKSQEDIDAFEAQILEKAKAKWDAELAEKELVKSATEIVKGFDFIAEDDHEVVVKALCVSEGMEVIVKCFEAAAAKVEKAVAEAEAAKEEFGSADQVSDDSKPVIEKGSLADTLKANIAKVKANK
ncbi:putative coil containing protein [Vibrio phage 501E54-1]|nr:putative coil containing protein [Vibrio phage 501E54-1]